MFRFILPANPNVAGFIEISEKWKVNALCTEVQPGYFRSKSVVTFNSSFFLLFIFGLLKFLKTPDRSKIRWDTDMSA